MFWDVRMYTEELVFIINSLCTYLHDFNIVYLGEALAGKLI